MSDSSFEVAIMSRLGEMERRHEELLADMSRPELLGDRQAMQRLGREQRTIEEPLGVFERIKEVDRELDDVRSLLGEGSDPELREMARDDLYRLQEQRESLLREAAELLRPR